MGVVQKRCTTNPLRNGSSFFSLQRPSIDILNDFDHTQLRADFVAPGLVRTDNVREN
jgi:hypothetical protein